MSFLSVVIRAPLSSVHPVVGISASDGGMGVGGGGGFGVRGGVYGSTPSEVQVLSAHQAWACDSESPSRCCPDWRR